MTKITPQLQLEILQKVEKQARKNYSHLSKEADEKQAEELLKKLN